ncbi:MAG TPA: lactate racemase domain-containing protein [Desulfobacterales bacterium]
MAHSATSPFPRVALVRQTLYRNPLEDITGSVTKSLARLPLSEHLQPNQRVAVAVGSRGIDRLAEVVSACIAHLKDLGLQPFVVPAMGSHGGATAEGQQAVLSKLGITPQRIGAPVEPVMDVECLDRLSNGTRLYFSTKALEADHIVLINRVKLHTKFRAPVESGLCKMLTIGLGKAEGAAEFHRRAVGHGFGIIESAAARLIERCPVRFGLALLEDGCGNLTQIKAVLPEAFIEMEKTLLKQASAMMARIPFDNLDVLVIDRIGKDISGIGMDSNVTGRHRDLVGNFDAAPHPRRIFVRDLSPASDGNANGIGLADATTRRLVDALDREKTYRNAITAISLEKAAIPAYFDTDREALEVCARSAGLESLQQARLVRILDTKHLEVLQVSESLQLDIDSEPNLQQLTPWEPLGFDAHDNLPPFNE